MQIRKALTFFLLVVSFYARADFWGLPETKYYFSEDSTFILKVVPLDLEAKFENYSVKETRDSVSNSTIFELVYSGKLDSLELKILEETNVCYAILYRTDSFGDTLEVWNQKLLNDFSPVNALVSNDGKRVVTFDEWGEAGYGNNVFVVYNEWGIAMENYELADFTLFPIEKYMISTSSIWWRCDAEILNDDYQVRICMKANDKSTKTRIYDLNSYKFK
jgi:hypothetical protein